MTKNKEVTKQRLGWFDTKCMRVTTEPKLDAVEEDLKIAFNVPI